MSDIHGQARDFARLMGPPKGTQPLFLRQGIVAGIEMGTVALYFSDNTFAAGGVSFLTSYQPQIGDTVWVVKNGPDNIVLGPVQGSGSEAESWHYIGQTEIGEPAFENGWTNFGGAYENAAFYMDPDGIVHLKGLIKFPTASGAKSITAFTLPDPYRPEYRVRAVMVAASTVATAGFWMTDIFPDGKVQFVGAGNGNDIGRYCSLSGVSFMAKGLVEYDRIHEWTPFGLTHGVWTWDADIENHTPPGVWDRWDGLMRARGRFHNGTNTVVALAPERSCKHRWNKLFASACFDGTLQLQPVRLDLRTEQRVFIRASTSLNQELTVEGLQWMADIPESYWTELDLISSWQNYSVSGDPQGKWGPAGYFKDGYGHVHLRGLISSGVTTTGTVFTNLPVDCCPERDEVFAAMSGGGNASRLEVKPNGQVLIRDIALGNNDYLSLDMIHFKANPNYTL